jgi:hypothetical protein
MNFNNEAATDRRILHIITSQRQLFFLNGHSVLPEDSTLVPKRVADAPLIFVLIKVEHLVGVI